MARNLIVTIKFGLLGNSFPKRQIKPRESSSCLDSGKTGKTMELGKFILTHPSYKRCMEILQKKSRYVIVCFGGEAKRFLLNIFCTRSAKKLNWMLAKN